LSLRLRIITLPGICARRNKEGVVHRALDFINAEAIGVCASHHFWQTDRDVKTWSAQAGLAEGSLSQAARQSGQLIRNSVQRQKAWTGRRGMMG